MGHGNQRLEIKLVQAFMPVLVTSNFDDDLIKNEKVAWRTIFPLQVYGKFFWNSRAANSLVSGPILPNSNSSEILCMSSIPASIKRIRSKTTKKRWRHHFPHYNSMGAFCCHGNQSFDPICPKTLCSLSLIPMMLHIKYDQDWPTGIRDIQVQKCEIFVTQGKVTPKRVV